MKLTTIILLVFPVVLYSENEDPQTLFDFVPLADTYIESENTPKKKEIVDNAYNMLNEDFDNEISKVNPEYNIGNVGLIGTGFFFITALGIYHERSKILKKVKIYKNNSTKTSVLILPKKTKEHIVQKLEEFEVSEEFLDIDMSFVVLVERVNTNSRYLEEVLRTEKNKDYKNYINELRINHIVSMLKTDKKYLSYKISYLAGMSGFSSHSKFSESFKLIKKMPPSEYISRLKRAS